MERFLDAYIECIRPSFPGYPEKTAHEIASAFLTFRFGLYAKAVGECTNAIAMIPGGEAGEALKKALGILRAQAQALDNSLVTADPGVVFSAADLRYVAITVPPETAEDPGTLNLDNALVLVYVVALLTSPDDEDALGEHRRFIVRLLGDYKKAMGME
jgi:hypothetical protein